MDAFKVLEKEAKRVAHLNALLKAARQRPASASRRWGLGVMTSNFVLRVEGWFTTQKIARQIAKHLGICNPIICRWHEVDELRAMR